MATELAAPAVGDLIDGFYVGETIHDGGMARIRRVDKGNLGFPLVMKVPKLEFGSHPACLVGFEAEQMIMESLSGPFAPRFVARGSDAGHPYLVIEYIPGESLATHARHAPLSADEIARLMAPVAAAVHGLHRQDVVHHDLKPENIRFRRDGRPVIIDFGLAHHSRLPDLVAEEIAIPVGTSAYLSPEQVRGVRGDPRSDVFALGVILYQLATGALPFGVPTTVAGFRRRLYTDPMPPRIVNPHIPEWLQEIILHCLELPAAERYATAGQVAHDLAHPEQVPLGARAKKSRPVGLIHLLRRWLRAQAPAASPSMPASAAIAAAHVLVALDFSDSSPAKLLAALRDETARLAHSRACRITCITVHQPDAFSDATEYRELANGLHAQGLIELRHWAAGLGLPASRLRYHVLSGSDAAERIIEYARKHDADLVLLGARGSSGLRRYIGSVSAKVAAEAPCSVSIIRCNDASGSCNPLG